MRYLLDADTVSFALRGEGGVSERIREQVPSEVGLSCITVAELRFGAHRRNSRKLHRLLDTFIGGLIVLTFDAAAADRYGRIAASLAASGKPIGILDTMVAAHALENDLTVVSHNPRHFQLVHGLDVEDWYRA